MAYGTVKVDTIIFDQGGADQNATVSGIYRAITSGVTVSGTIAGAVLIGTTTVSGTTVTGTTANFASGVFTTQVSGATVTGTQSSFTSGNFVTLSGATATFTSGVIASGTAAAPSLSILGDPNTGIYSPGADQVAVATNGTGRLFVDASGRVGIGTSSQEQRLTVLDNSTSVASGSTLTVNGGTFNTGGEGGSIAFSNTVKTGITHAARIRSGLVFLDVQETGNLIFDTNGGAGLTERLRITSAGNVGIGTSSPQAQLQVLDRIKISDSTQAQGSLQLGDGASTTFNVGLARWNGSANAPGAAGLGYFSQGTGNSGGHYFYTGDVAAGSQTARMIIAPGGNVGIGTTSPGDKLDVLGIVRATNTTDSNFYSTFSNPDGLTRIRAYGGGSSICFDLGTSEKARIDSSGRLLVGTSTARSNFFNTTATSGFQVEGTGENAYLSIVQNNTSTAVSPFLILARSKGASVGSNTAVASGDALGVLSYQGNDGTEFVEAARITAEVDGTPGANDMPGRLVFSTTADGASSPTERMRITSGGYIKASNTGTYTDGGGGSRATNLQHFFRSDQNGLTVQATNTNTSSAVEGFTSDFVTGATGNHFIGAVNLVRVFIVAADGNVTNTNNIYGAISDTKLKENIVDAGSQWADLKTLQVRKYNFKEGQTHTQIGLIAQEAELVSPGLVSESPDLDTEGNELGTVTKSVNYSVLYMKAVKALQEAMERIETLEARLTAAGIE